MMYGRASVECIRVGVCVTELGGRNYSTPSSSLSSLAVWGRCGGGVLPADLRAAWGGGGLCRMK